MENEEENQEAKEPENQQPLLGKHFVFVLHDQITPESSHNLMQMIKVAVFDCKSTQITIAISSPGGSVPDGVALFNFLRSLKHVNIVTHNIGRADSIANIIFLSGDERYACQGTSFLFHGVTYNLAQASFTYSKFAEVQKQFKADEDLLVDIIAANTNLTPENLINWFAEGETLRASEAVQWGVIDEVKEFTVPTNSVLVVLDDTRKLQLHNGTRVH